MNTRERASRRGKRCTGEMVYRGGEAMEAAENEGGYRQ